jgi:hypothetical protein
VVSGQSLEGQFEEFWTLKMRKEVVQGFAFLIVKSEAEFAALRNPAVFVTGCNGFVTGSPFKKPNVYAGCNGCNG